MKRVEASDLLLAAAMLLSTGAHAQTGCANGHTQPGVFICYPNSAAHSEDGNVATIFHISAQANAPAHRRIAHYVVLIDNQRVYESRLSMALERLSIEINVKSPFNSGLHTLHLVVDRTGSAETTGLTFHPSKLGFCDPFNRVEPHHCLTSRFRQPLEWSIGSHYGKANDLFSGYLDYLQLYSQNLESIEADVADAVTVDAEGNIYTASHSSADVEISKFSADGSLLYDNLVRSRGSGFVSVTGIAVDSIGRIWVAGNTTAPIPVTPAALETAVAEPTRPHGFLVRIDVTKSGSAVPIYVTYLSSVENEIRALRVDRDGIPYLAGVTNSEEFPHQSILRISKTAGAAPNTSRQIGFVAALDSLGSVLRWSTLLPDTQLEALALDDSGKVYVTGRTTLPRTGATSGGVLVAALSDHGHELSYVAHIGGLGIGEGRAISTDTDAKWVFVEGETRKGAHAKIPRPLVVALQPCSNGKMFSQLLPDSEFTASTEVAVQPALDAFDVDFRKTAADIAPLSHAERRYAFVQALSNCPAVSP